MSLEIIAKNLANKGRYGDSVLVHMAPEEVAGLQSLAQRHGTSLSINPYTGMPEAFKLKSIFKPIKSAVSSIGDVVKDVIKPVAKIAPFVLPFIPIPGIAGLSPLLTRSILGGIAGGFGGKGGFDLKRGLFSGLASYGLGSLMNPATANAATGGAGGGFDMGGMGDVTSNFTSQAASSGIPIPTGDVSVSSIPATPSADFADGISSAYTPPEPTTGSFDLAGTGGAYQGSTAGAPIFDSSVAATDTSGIRGLDPAGERYLDAAGNLLSSAGDTLLTQVTEKPLQTAAAAFTGYSSIKTKEELDKQKEEAERILRDRENQKAADIAYAEGILRDYPLMYQRLSAADVQKYGLAGGGMAYDDELGNDYAVGGLTALAKGGAMPPRFLSGGGDGMSDSIPARIAGKQEARLADGEFVVPADVVSHLGNGSSKAGAKKLYAMMDRARQARTGKKQQAPAIKAERVMPA